MCLNAKEKPSEDPCRVPYKCEPVSALLAHYINSAAKTVVVEPTTSSLPK